MKIQYLALSVILLAVACTKEDKPEEEKSDARYVSSVVSSFDSIAFDYNADHTLRRKAQFVGGKTDAENSYISFLQYTGGNVTGVNFTHDINSANGTPMYSLSYNADNLVGKITSQSGLGYDSVVCNAQRQVTEIYYIEIPHTVKYRWNLTWKDGNLVKMTRYVAAVDKTDVQTYTYDLHPNMYIHTGVLNLTNINDIHYLSKNNVTRIDYDLAADRDRGLIQSHMFTYTYDTLKYPAKILFASEYIEHGDTSDYYVDDSARVNYLP